MLFGRAAAKESVPLEEMEAYLSLCFNGKLRRLSTRLPVAERALSDSFAAFGASMQEFSGSSTPADMDYLYGVKENFMESQKENYASSVLHLISSPPKYAGAGAHQRAKDILEAYSSFTTSVMKVNNSFKFVMIGYAKSLSEVKRHFTAMERYCGELRSELALCTPDESEYNSVKSKLMTMEETALEISALKRPPGFVSHHHISVGEGEEQVLHKQVQEKEASLALARRKRLETNSVLANLLLPVERAARKHDHLSATKRKLGDYLADPAEEIKTAEDGRIIHEHLLKIEQEVKEGTIDAKNSDSLISQISSIRSSDLLSLAASARDAEAEVKRGEAELDELRLRLRVLERAKEAAHRSQEEKATTEKQIETKQAHLLSEKKELEKLLSSCYKKNVDILLP